MQGEKISWKKNFSAWKNKILRKNNNISKYFIIIEICIDMILNINNINKF